MVALSGNQCYYNIYGCHDKENSGEYMNSIPNRNKSTEDYIVNQLVLSIEIDRVWRYMKRIREKRCTP